MSSRMTDPTVLPVRTAMSGSIVPAWESHRKKLRKRTSTLSAGTASVRRKMQRSPRLLR